MVLAAIEAKKVMVRGEEKFKIEAVENVMERDELPMQYIERGYPYFYKTGCGIGLFTKEGMRTIRIGSVLSPETFGELMSVLKTAGARLAEINRDIKKREAEWCDDGKVYKI